MVAPKTKQGGQKVLRDAGGEWSHLEQRGVARRC